MRCILLLFCFVSACDNRSVANGRQFSGLSRKMSSTAIGYSHTIERSRFRLGQSPVSLSELEWNKIVGSEGTFATDPRTGAVLALPNAGAPSITTAALTENPDENNSRVMDYFVSAGLPKEQISGVNVLTAMTASGRVGDTNPVEPKFVAYTSVLQRSLGNVIVADSFAWARFNINDDVVTEGVYWPSIPGQTIDDANALVALISDEKQASTYTAKLPPGGSLPGIVVIHHSNSASKLSFTAYASYDVMYRGYPGRGSARHFDINGNELPDIPLSSVVHVDSPKS